MRIERGLAAAGVVLTAAAGGALLVVPLYAGTSEDSAGHASVTHATLVEVNGPGVLWVPGTLLVLAAATAWLPWVRLRPVPLVAFLALTLLAMMTIGSWFLPAAACLAASVALRLGSTPG